MKGPIFQQFSPGIDSCWHLLPLPILLLSSYTDPELRSFLLVGWLSISCLFCMQYRHVYSANVLCPFTGSCCQCQLPFHSYVREVADDGSVVGGVEIEVPVRDEPAGLRTHFFGAILVQRWLFCTSSLP
jgi:hypothetical protein